MKTLSSILLCCFFASQAFAEPAYVRWGELSEADQNAWGIEIERQGIEKAGATCVWLPPRLVSAVRGARLLLWGGDGQELADIRCDVDRMPDGSGLITIKLKGGPHAWGRLMLDFPQPPRGLPVRWPNFGGLEFGIAAKP